MGLKNNKKRKTLYAVIKLDTFELLCSWCVAFSYASQEMGQKKRFVKRKFFKEACFFMPSQPRRLCQGKDLKELTEAV